MTTVALIGPDGAGKTTVAREVVPLLPVPVRSIYMGVSPSSADVTLPTTRLAWRLKRAFGGAPDTAGPRDPDRPRPRSRSFVRRRLGDVRAGLRLANRVAEEWYRQRLARRWERDGNLVLFDRHFFADYLAYDLDGPGLTRTQRLHAVALRRLPRPDLVIYLDAPGEVLFARKGEGTVESLERRRADYRAIEAYVPAFVEVDATQPLPDVVATVAAAIRAHLPADERAMADPSPGPA